MKKILFSGLFALAILATAGYGVNKSLNNEKLQLSDLALANVEALAGGEGPSAGGVLTLVCQGTGDKTCPLANKPGYKRIVYVDI